jgi:hypothetical protein
MSLRLTFDGSAGYSPVWDFAPPTMHFSAPSLRTSVSASLAP